MGVKEFIKSVKDIWTKEYTFPGYSSNSSTKDAMAGTHRVLFTHSYDGEKDLGEIGPVKVYTLNYDILRARSWQSYLESGITQTVLRKFTLWMIGAGLKLQCEPSENFFKTERVAFDTNAFSEQVEPRWSVFTKSRMSDYANMSPLSKQAVRAYLNAIVGGDVLVVLRLVNNQVKVQLIDGCHVQSPTYGTDAWPANLPNGNQIKNGIEMTPAGEHVAYYVRDSDYKVNRISARGENSGMIMAYMCTGLEYRLDNNRGMPLVATVMEKIAKLSRYEEATIGSAEERQKIAYFIEHATNSTGASPLLGQLAKARNVGPGGSDQLPITTEGKQLANTVAATTNKATFNMVPDSTLKMLESKNELYFKDFFTVNIDLICACIGIPPNVAMSKYDSNFSASRAALKDWEHVLNVGRVDFATQFYQPIYNLWLETEILLNKIQAPGYLIARYKGNDMMVEAIRTARFVGPNVPHIDPLKEVQAERLKMGSLGNTLPLSTLESSTEALNGGESMNNLDQFAKEKNKAGNLGLVV